jgi:hypothetical protein
VTLSNVNRRADEKASPAHDRLSAFVSMNMARFW